MARPQATVLPFQTTRESGGVMAPVDLPGAAEMQWENVGGVTPQDPLVGASVPGMPYDVGRGGRIVTTPQGQAGPTGGVMAPADVTPGMAHFDSWRDLFNFKGSPAPWVLLLALAMIGFLHLSIQANARAGRARAGAAAAI